MHHCLQCPEIVRLVVAGLWDRHEPDVYAPIVTSITVHASTCTSLARLARTCRAFQSHALDALWSHQVGIENLLHCMPWVLVNRGRGSRGSMLATASSDWGRFDFYARRIKAMKIRSDFPHTIAARSMCKALSENDEHPRPYLPNLIQLICELSISTEMLRFCLTLLGPSLRVLRLEGSDLVSAPFMLPCACYLAGSLQHLGFPLDASPDTLVLLEESLKSLHQLRRLSLTLLALPRSGIWKALSGSQTLARLTIRMKTSVSPSTLETPELVSLPSLTRLTLQAPFPGYIHLF
ncbi:hypothetical protein C8Q72DRAFT_281688 [Fomitopsis betulina]|nr:hypothetical protein C8Q72DRAFT_281688 [Fomitopsis betulina]